MSENTRTDGGMTMDDNHRAMDAFRKNGICIVSGLLCRRDASGDCRRCNLPITVRLFKISEDLEVIAAAAEDPGRTGTGGVGNE